VTVVLLLFLVARFLLDLGETAEAPQKNQHTASLAGIHVIIKVIINANIVQTKNQQSSTANHIASTIAQSNVAVIANKPPIK
jgi:NADH:ubiquinone oxidoreductase subunit 6 (subunit J)